MYNQKSHAFEMFSLQIANFDYKKRFLQKLYRWIWAFGSYIDLCIGQRNEPAIFCNNHAHALFHILHAYLRFFCWSMSIGVDFVLGIKWCLFRDLLNWQF